MYLHIYTTGESETMIIIRYCRDSISDALKECMHTLQYQFRGSLKTNILSSSVNE